MADDYADNTGTTGLIDFSNSDDVNVTGNIESAQDLDWFAVSLEAGRTYQFDMKGSATQGGRFGSLANPHIWGIHDASGNLLHNTSNGDGGWGANARVRFTPTDDGTYYVSAGAANVGTGTYTLRARDRGEAAPAASQPAWTHDDTITVGGNAEGYIHSNEMDEFTVDLEAGKAYVFSVAGQKHDYNGDGNRANDPSHPSPEIYGIRNSDGGYNSETSRSSREYVPSLEFVPFRDGTYTVVVKSNDQGRERGGYTLSVAEAADDYSAGTGTTGAVAVGGSSTGILQFRGDIDWFAVDLQAGHTYRIDVKGAATSDGTLVNPYLHNVYDPNGRGLPGTSDDDGGFGNNASLAFTPTVDGTHYVAASHPRNLTEIDESDLAVLRSTKSGDGRTYKVEVTDITPPPEPGTLPLPRGPEEPVNGVETLTTFTGEIDYPRETDSYAVSLQAGVTYEIDLEGSRTSMGTLYDPYLRGIRDADNNFIPGTKNDDGGTGLNSKLTWTAPEDGTYYIIAGAWGSSTGTYTLTVDEV